MNKVIFTFILGMILLLHIRGLPYTPHKKKQSVGVIEKRIKRIARIFKKKAIHKTHAKVIVSMIFGYKRGLSKKIKNSFKDLNLLHLFTPSGLHFSSLFIFLTPLFRLTNKWNRHSGKSLTLLFCLLPFTLLKFYSLKRIALLKILSIFFYKKISFYKLFLLTFTIDFFWGSFQDSPLSFAYSFIFLGALLSFKELNFKLLLALFTGQIIVAMFLQTPINLVGPFLGFFMTSLFTILFPLLLISFIFFPLIGTLPAESLIRFYLSLVNMLTHIIQDMPVIDASFGVVFIMMILLSSLTRMAKRRIFILCLALLF